MSLRKEQCKKVCRILDDVLANRPTERDSLIVAVRKAFESLEQFGNSEPLPSAQPKWMKAKWKPVEVDSDDNVWLWECENCHEETEFKWDFCPVCGCEMTNATKVNG